MQRTKERLGDRHLSFQMVNSAQGDMSRSLRNFAVIGGVGFAIEAVLLTMLVQIVDWAPWHARIPSFLTAVLVTWRLNRRHTFTGRGLERRSLEALSYGGIQVCGAAINLVLFGVSLSYLPKLATVPAIPLGIGAVGGFAFNFFVSDLLLYSRSRSNSR